MMVIYCQCGHEVHQHDDTEVDDSPWVLLWCSNCNAHIGYYERPESHESQDPSSPVL